MEVAMSADVLPGTCGHDRPDFLHGAANAITFKVPGFQVALKVLGKTGKTPEKTTWSEWQDLNLRPLRPERSEHFLSH